MGKMARILLVLGLAWVGVEVYTEGVDGAFGGFFSSEKEAEAAVEYVRTPERVGERARQAMQQDEERTRRLLGD